jgi:hypothetical protein
MTRQVSGSRCERQADDGAMGGRAISDVFGSIAVRHINVGQAQTTSEVATSASATAEDRQGFQQAGANFNLQSNICNQQSTVITVRFLINSENDFHFKDNIQFRLFKPLISTYIGGRSPCR